jgi:hypothetical protein
VILYWLAEPQEALTGEHYRPLKRGDHVTFNGTDFLVINRCTGLVDEVNIAQDLLTFMRRMGFGTVVL